MILPSRRLLWLIAAALALAVAASLVSGLAPVWAALALIALIVALADAALFGRIHTPDALREVPGSLALGIRREVTLRLSNPNSHAIALDLHDHHPEACEVEGLPLRVRIAAGGWVRLAYAVKPVARGEHVFGRIELRLDSRLGLWQMRRLAGQAQTVRVYPNFAALTKYALLATDHRLSEIGVLQRRRRGEGLDFQQLREYRQGDALRSIDWKATARTAKLISREYQDERNQQVVFLIDCGRRMAARDGPLAHFDHVLDAALLLAYVSLRQGDAVGLLTMGTQADDSTRYVAPRKSAAMINVLLNSVYDLAPTLATADYYGAAVELMKRVSKRALVVMLTNLRDEDDAELAPALGLLQSRHLVVMASLRERILAEALRQPVASFEAAITHAATAAYLRRRESTFAKLARRGAICLDVEPDALALSLVNRYLDVKRSGRL